MKYSQILEGVEYGDLQSLISTNVSIAEFEPKTGTNNDVVVVGFYCKDEAPAADLSSFIERSVVEILDTEVSPSPDENGLYMVFVEIENQDLMSKVFGILDDVSRLAEIESWDLQFYNDKSQTIEAEQITQWLKKNR